MLVVLPRQVYNSGRRCSIALYCYVNRVFSYDSPLESKSIGLYALNTETMRWTHPIPNNSVEHLVVPLEIADADIIRAKRNIETEQQRAISLGKLQELYL